MRINPAFKQYPLLLLLALICFGCVSVNNGGDIFPGFKGTVTDSLTGMPIDSAIVTLGDTVQLSIFAYTDTTGKYVILTGGFGAFDVFCRKPGYRTKQISISVTFQRQEIEGVDFQLTK